MYQSHDSKQDLFLDLDYIEISHVLKKSRMVENRLLIWVRVSYYKCRHFDSKTHIR